MDKILKEKWVEALKSGKYRQGKGYLKQKTSDGDVEYCCLGVLAECYDPEFFYSTHENNTKIFISKSKYNYSVSILSDKIRQEIYLSYDDMCSLANLNDVHNKDFNYIAEWVEEKL